MAHKNNVEKINHTLSKYCKVNTNEDGDRFVGIKRDIDKVVVHFPIGYQLPKDDKTLRRDVVHLLRILREFSGKGETAAGLRSFSKTRDVDFPVDSYLEIITNFLESRGYFIETELIHKIKSCGKVNWKRTIQKQKVLLQPNGSPIYTKFFVNESTIDDNKLITQIHKYCVYESFNRLGWLFTSFVPNDPKISVDRKRFIVVLNDKLFNTHNEKNKRLFKAMVDVLECTDDSSKNMFYYGTDKFEVVWERLVDKVYGIYNKKDYFPRTKWILRYNENKSKYPLEPDSIMFYSGNIYVLDAKYYRYGVTEDSSHLPESSSINKQITYGEYIYNMKREENQEVYNAFIMPFNSSSNKFGITTEVGTIGEAIGEWKVNLKNYQRIQGIVIDVRYLMYQVNVDREKNIEHMARVIEDSLESNTQLYALDENNAN